MICNPEQFVFLDRDGVINRDLPRSVCSVDDFEILPRAPGAISTLSNAGYRVILITNQACLGRGDLSVEELERIHDRLHREVAAANGVITDIFVCPHTDADHCNCRKPKPGLIRQAAGKYAIDLSATWFVGDALRDVQAALAAGCLPAVVRSGKALDSAIPPDIPVFDDLQDFATALTTAGIC